MISEGEVVGPAREWHVLSRLAQVITLASLLSSCLPVSSAPNDIGMGVTERVIWPVGDPQTGKDLFVEKGCVICHSVNGVGGRAALPLDAPPDGRKLDPMVFAAAMWEGASAMVSLQFTELGYQIGMTGEELLHLTAFASDLKAQTGFSLDDIPRDLLPWIIDLPHWQRDDWPIPFDSQPDGMPSPFEDL